MAKGLDWYILEADKNEKNYQYHVLMTLMEQEFNISFLNALCNIAQFPDISHKRILPQQRKYSFPDI